ncbi:MAG: hypothetical protein B6I37_08145 [Desulfobacteraceae bacterium 4572_35.2]|jgi:hypothetical protein|nr:MAG: hypothetical protein B6I37_08145 [Desulfobacteraceae bacterium 4572_35.2]
MSNVRVDHEKNRLYITLKGVFNLPVAKEVKGLLEDEIADIPAGFDVITDLTRVEIGYLCALPIFKEMVEVLADKEVGTVVRVVDKGSTILQQLTNAAAQLGYYQPQYVSTVDEAEKLLDSQS